ncbi:hypothetical protein JRI60_51825 [Archangium violaceum]|nr:hypothetical protein [Archangium violaceum]QRN97344.1 hypothetical protein JRI60_51825 [Archangium violaceum]
MFATLPTRFEPVRIGDTELTAALTTMVLDMPLRVAVNRPPLYVGRKLALAASSTETESWHSELARAYGRFCERRGAPGDCLTLYEDGPPLHDDDRRSIALALAVGPALESLDAELRTMLSPTRLLATVSISITAHMALLVAPEPVSKGVATTLTVLLWGYLGWEFFDLIRGYVQLSEASARATTFAELREAGERFGRVIGPNSVRILVLLGTAAVGETAALMSRAPRLPGFTQAARSVESSTGLRLVEAAAGTERVIVSVPEGTLRVVLPANALAVTGQDWGRTPPVTHGNGHRAFKTFKAFKKFMGPAGEGKQWHHIVEQHEGNAQRFGPEALHNTENVIPLEENIHLEINRLYSSKSDELGGMVVRDWLRTQSYEQQRAYGLRILRAFGITP